MGNTDNSRLVSRAPAWMIALAAVLGTVLVGIPKQSDATKQDSTAKTSSRDPAEGERSASTHSSPDAGNNDPLIVLRELNQFRADPPGAMPTAIRLSLGPGTLAFETVPASSPPAVTREGLSQQKAKYEFLALTVPDPIDSKFALDFDSVVQAVQRAYEARGFVLQSSWMPWPRSTSVQKGPREQVYRNVPGSMLFRSHRKEKSGVPIVYSLVCLVGENPTSGVHKAALTTALDLYVQLSHALPNPDNDWSEDQSYPFKDESQCRPSGEVTIPIVGPYYTGFQTAFVNTLQKWAKDPFGGQRLGKGKRPRFRVISGSATDVEPEKYFAPTDGQITFQATVIPSYLLTHGVLAYLQGERKTELPIEIPRLPRLAWLRESNTVFGMDADRQKHDTQDNTSLPLDIPFPLSISQFELEFEALEARKGSPPRLPSSDLIGPRLPIRAGPQLDGLAPYDREAAAVIAYQSLRAILTTIDREQIRFVGIQATDPRDIVFLNKLLTQYSPSVRVFTTESSVALLDPNEAYHMRGMLVASTYPLYPLTQRWYGTVDRLREKSTATAQCPSPTTSERIPWNARIAFPSQGSQGYYNAVLAQFGNYRSMLDYRPVGWAGRDDERPAIWVSIIGQGGVLVPVHVYTEYDDRLKFEKSCEPQTYVFRVPCVTSDPDRGLRPPPLHPLIDTPPSAIVTHILVFLLLCVGIAACWKERWGAFLGSSTLNASSSKPGLDTVLAVWLWRGLLVVSVAALAIPQGLAFREAFEGRCFQPDDWGYAMIAMAGLINVALLFFLVSLVLRPLRNYKGERAGSWTLAAISLLIYLVAWWVWGCRSGAERFFSYVRIMDVGAAVSPVSPVQLLAAAALTLAWFPLRQLWMGRAVWINCPFGHEWPAITSRNLAVRDAFLRPVWFLTGAGWVSLGALASLSVLIAVGVYRWVKDLPAEDGLVWDSAIWLATALLTLGVAAGLGRILASWHALAELLKEFHRLPLAAAFNQLSDPIRKASANVQSHRPRLSVLRTAIWSLEPAERIKLQAELARMTNDRLNWLFSEPSGCNQEITPLDEQVLIAVIDRLAELSLRNVQAAWRERTLEEGYGTYREPSKPESAKEVSADERFLATILVLYVGSYLAQLRTLLFAPLIAAPLLLFAVASYPFEPERPRLNLQAGVVAIVLATGLYVFVQINRNAFLSRLARTTEDRFTPGDPGFLSSVLTYLLPLVLVLAAHILGLFRVVLDPLLALVR